MPLTRGTACLLAALLALAACGGDGKKRTSGPTGSPAASPDGTATGGPGDGSGGGGTGSGGGGGQGGDGGSGSGKGRIVAPSPGLSNLPRKGTFVYEITPLPESPAGGPTIPPHLYEKQKQEIEVLSHKDAPGGNDVLFELRSPAQGQSSKDWRRDRWTRSDAKLMRWRECRVDPPITLLKFPIKPESYGEQKGSMKECTRGGSETRRITVLGREMVDAAGRSWNTWKIESRTTLANDSGQSAETLERYWLAPELGLHVKGTFETTLPNGVKFFTTEILLRHP